MTLTDVLNTLPSTNNFRCNGAYCKSSTGKVRIIPLDDSLNVHLCSDCYTVELGVSFDRELEGKDRILPDLPFEVYPIYFGEAQ